MSKADRKAAAPRVPLGSCLLLAHALCVSAVGGEPGDAAGAAAAGRPFVVPNSGATPLWRLPFQRLVIVGHDTPWPPKQVRVFTTAPPRPRSFVTQVHDKHGVSHDALAVYCFRSWNVVDRPVRTAWIEFPLQLPQEPPTQLRAVLHFAKPSTKGDDKRPNGRATWRVRVRPAQGIAGEVGRLVFEWGNGATTWQEIIVDLSDFAGQAIWLQLAVPAQKWDTRVYWVAPRIIAGRPEPSEPSERNVGKNPH